MQKIRNAVFERMLHAGLTKAEVDFLLHISHYQDDTGRIVGVYYRDVCEALKLSCQTFYDVLRSLERKRLIRVDKEHYGDWDVTILDNRFTEGSFDGYISTGDDLFFHPAFQELKGPEKLLAMQLLKITKNPNNGGKYRIEVEKFREKYCELLHVTKRVLLRYLRKLKQFFSIGIKDRLLYIRPLAGVGKKTAAPKDKELFQTQVGGAAVRRQRATYTRETLQDTVSLISQYARDLGGRAAELFESAVEESIRRRNSGIKDRYKWNRELNPKFIHKLLTEKLKSLRLGGCF